MHLSQELGNLMSICNILMSRALGPLSQVAIEAFNSLRVRLLSPPIVALPRAVGKLFLDTDASNGQLGCCLS